MIPMVKPKAKKMMEERRFERFNLEELKSLVVDEAIWFWYWYWFFIIDERERERWRERITKNALLWKKMGST